MGIDKYVIHPSVPIPEERREERKKCAMDSFAKKFKGKIATVHISDYDFIQERHAWPGLGKINWPELYKAICDTDYEGVWMYEMHLKQPGFEGTFDDIYKLTMDIFAGKEPEILPNL